MQQEDNRQLDLSPFDQSGPRLYVHKFFCFEFLDSTRQAEAVERLEQCLSATILRWPFITGHVSPVESADGFTLALHYKTPAIGQLERKLLTVKNVSNDEFDWTYQELVRQGMPPRLLNMQIFSSVPEWPNSIDTYPALAIQANFIDGGLILCFAFHHAVADGGSFTAFVKEFAATTKHPVRHDSAVEMPVTRRIDYGSAQGHNLRSLQSHPEYNPGNAPIRPRSTGPITTRILTFSARTVSVLTETVLQHVKATVGDHAWASDIASLSSLVWVAVVRARQARLDRNETVKMGIAVNFRNVLTPPLPEDYFGNAIVHTNALAKVSEFLEDDQSVRVDGICSSIPIANVALAAWRMRQAVKGVDSDYVNERLQTFSALSDPTEVSRAYGRAMDTSNTGIDFSSWRDQGADLMFGIPGTTTSTVDFWRKAWSPNEGAYNILPRKGGSKGEADWEVSLGLSVEDMDRVCSMCELGGWMSRMVE